MAEFPALQLWTDAYLGDTAHLTTIEHGAYLLLLMTAWRTGDCSLPDDDKMLARYCRMTAVQWARIKPLMLTFWQVQNGRWMQRRLTDEYNAVRQKREAAAMNGKLSALKRKGRHVTERERSDNGASTTTATATATANHVIANAITDVAAQAPRKRGCRLPVDWMPPALPDDVADAAWPGFQEAEARKFCDYWKAQPGQKGVKTDWEATWRNWVRRAMEQGNGLARNGNATGARQGPNRGTAAIVAVHERYARMASQGRGDRPDAEYRGDALSGGFGG